MNNKKILATVFSIYVIMIVPNYTENTVSAFEFYEKMEWLKVDDDPKFCLVEYPDELVFLQIKKCLSM